jgi:hypothetical protein
MSQSHAALVELGDLSVEHSPQDRQQALYLGLRAAPVLSRKSIDREELDAEFNGCLQYSAQVFYPCAMASYSR